MIGKKLKALRESANMNQKETAAKIGIPYQTYRNYETDTCDPDNEMLVKLCDYYSVSADWLLSRNTETDKSPPDNQIREALYQKLLLLDDDTIQQVIDYVKYLIWREKQG